VTGVLGRGDVVGGDAGDALAVHLVERDPGVEGQRGEDGGFGCGVVPLDVGRRVGLRVPELLGLLHRLVEVEPLGGHLVQHVVGGAVDDAEHPQDPVTGQRLAHRTHQGDRTGDRCLEVQVDLGRVGCGVERRAVLGEQRLVRGDHGRPCGDRPEQEGPGRLETAHELDDDVRTGDESLGVGGEEGAVDDRVPLGREVAHRDPDQLERGAHPGAEVHGLCGQQPDDFRPDDAASQNCDTEPLHWSDGRCCHGADTSPQS
jgi:hypothetical protein